MSHVVVHQLKPRLASSIVAVGMLVAAGCSEPPAPVMNQLADDPDATPKIKAILASDKTPKEKNKLIKDEFLGKNFETAAGKAGSKARKTKKSPLPN